MCTIKTRDEEQPPDGSQPRPHTLNEKLANVYPNPAITTPELESFMHSLCDLIDAHPEWLYQSQPERMENFLRAVQQL